MSHCKKTSKLNKSHRSLAISETYSGFNTTTPAEVNPCNNRVTYK